MRQNALFFFIILIICCSKESDTGKNDEWKNDEVKIDTIFTSEYFTAYPNSYWMYKTSNNDTVIHKTDSKYFQFSNYDAYHNPYDSSLYYAPLYDSRIVKKYSIATYLTDYHSSRWRLFIDDSLYHGKVFWSCYIWPNTHRKGKVMNIDTTIFLNSVKYDSVIVIMEYEDEVGYRIHNVKYYYAKHIGIIKRMEWWEYDSIINEENLIEYKINE